MRVLFIADQFADVSRTPEDKYPGGAELTDEAALEVCPWPIDCVTCEDVDLTTLGDYDLHILGNTQSATPALFEALSAVGRHILFEHDVRICNWRGNFPVLVEPSHRIFQRCICPHRHLRKLYDTSLGAIFLTHRQLAVFEQNPFFRSRANRVIGCSLFSNDLFERLEKPAQERSGTLFFDSRSKIKGGKAAREFAVSQGWSPKAIRDLRPPEVLDLFERSERFVYTPLGLEPAGRMVVEARLLGCEVVVNDHVGVSGESWWNLPQELAVEFLKDAPNRFWRLVEELADGVEGPRPPTIASEQRKRTVTLRSPS